MCKRCYRSSCQLQTLAKVSLAWRVDLLPGTIFPHIIEDLINLFSPKLLPDITLARDLLSLISPCLFFLRQFFSRALLSERMEQATRPKDSHVPIVADMKIKEHIPKHLEKKKKRLLL